MTEFPHQLQVESSMACNARCMFCPRPTLKRKGGVMKDWLFEKILAEAHDFKPHLNHIALFYMGEPLIFPRLFQWMQRLREEQFQTSIFTNALALTPDKATKLVSFSDIITDVVLSLDGMDSETYQDIMGIDYDTVRSNVIAFVKENAGKIKVSGNCALFSKSQPFMHKWQETWSEVLPDVSLRPHSMYNYAGLIHDELEHRADEKHAPAKCSRLWHISILWDGRVNLCCMDPEGQVVLGDVKENTLWEIFHGELPTYYREMHNKGRFSELLLCKDCNMNILLKEKRSG